MSITYHQHRKGTCAMCGEKRPVKELTATIEVQQVCLACAEHAHSLRDLGVKKSGKPKEAISMETLAVAEKTRGINNLKYVALMDELSHEYFYYDGVLLVNADLPKDRILEIISLHLELPAQDCADGSFCPAMERGVNHV